MSDQSIESNSLKMEGGDVSNTKQSISNSKNNRANFNHFGYASFSSSPFGTNSTNSLHGNPLSISDFGMYPIGATSTTPNKDDVNNNNNKNQHLSHSTGNLDTKIANSIPTMITLQNAIIENEKQNTSTTPKMQEENVIVINEQKNLAYNSKNLTDSIETSLPKLTLNEESTNKSENLEKKIEFQSIEISKDKNEDKNQNEESNSSSTTNSEKNDLKSIEIEKNNSDIILNHPSKETSITEKNDVVQKNEIVVNNFETKQSESSTDDDQEEEEEIVEEKNENEILNVEEKDNSTNNNNENITSNSLNANSQSWAASVYWEALHVTPNLNSNSASLNSTSVSPAGSPNSKKQISQTTNNNVNNNDSNQQPIQTNNNQINQKQKKNQMKPKDQYCRIALRFPYNERCGKSFSENHERVNHEKMAHNFVYGKKGGQQQQQTPNQSPVKASTPQPKRQDASIPSFSFGK